MCDYPQLFEGMGTMKDEYAIKLKDDEKTLCTDCAKKSLYPTV